VEHFDLVSDKDEGFLCGGGKDVVPEEGHLRGEGPAGVDHTVEPRTREPVPTGDASPAGEDIHVDVWEVFGAQQVFDDGLVAPGGAGLKLVRPGPEPGPAHQVGYLGKLVIGHGYLRGVVLVPPELEKPYLSFACGGPSVNESLPAIGACHGRYQGRIFHMSSVRSGGMLLTRHSSM